MHLRKKVPVGVMCVSVIPIPKSIFVVRSSKMQEGIVGTCDGVAVGGTRALTCTDSHDGDKR